MQVAGKQSTLPISTHSVFSTVFSTRYVPRVGLHGLLEQVVFIIIIVGERNVFSLKCSSLRGGDGGLEDAAPVRLLLLFAAACREREALGRDVRRTGR